MNASVRIGWLAVFLAAAAALGQEAKQAQAPRVRQMTIQQAQQYSASMQNLSGLFTEKKFAEALELCGKMAQAFPDDPTVAYNQACCLARLGRADEAFTALAKSVDLGFGDAQHMQEDADLESLRTDKRFDALTAKSREMGQKRKAEQAAVAEKARKYAELQQQLSAQFDAKKYEEAIATCDTMIELAPEDPNAIYNKACALARLGRADQALQSLEQAVKAGFSDGAHMKQDPDLESLRGDKRFTDLAAKMREAELKADYEKGKDIPGVKTVEGLPEGGLRYRLRMSPSATAEKPNRLLVWLHPSGGSMNAQIENLAPQFIERGFALLVLTRKSFLGWSEEDMDKLTNVTLPEVAKTPGIDGTRPILIGFSAGGQAALLMYMGHPAQFGGLVLDAAYPIEQGNGGRITPLEPPKDSAVGKVPLFVLVGTKDPGSILWKQAATAWRDAGAPLVIHYVAGQGHAWLLDKARAAALTDWLKQVAAGEKPNGTVGAPPTAPAAPGPTL